MRISDWSSDVCSSDLMETSGVTTSVPPALRQLTVAVMSQPGRAAAGALTLISTRPALTSSDTWKAPAAAADPSAVSTFRSYRPGARSEEHTSELQSIMRISYAVFCLKTQTT